MKPIELIAAFNNRFKAGDIVQHFKQYLLTLDESKEGKYRYEIVAVGEHTRTGEPLVVYKSIAPDGKVWVRPMSEFISRVDRNKYPEAPQDYRFEVVEA